MTLDITLQSQVAEAGGRFTGQLTRAADADGLTSSTKARGVQLALRYHTEGRGDTDRRTVTELRFDLDSHGGLYTTFDLAVPTDVPISYDGSLIRVRWEIEARVDLKMARDPKIERHVLVVPTGGLSIYDRPHPLSKPGWPAP